MKISEFYLCFHNSCEIWHLFSRAHMMDSVLIYSSSRTQPLICVRCSVHYWVSCAINKGWFFFNLVPRAFALKMGGDEVRIFWDYVFVVDTHLPRFEALAYVLPHFDALTHVVILVSSAFIFQRFAEVWYSVFVKRSSICVCWIVQRQTNRAVPKMKVTGYQWMKNMRKNSTVGRTRETMTLFSTIWMRRVILDKQFSSYQMTKYVKLFF